MSEMTKEQLQEEFQTLLREALAHPPFPTQGTPANKALLEMYKEYPVIAQVVLPRLMAATLEWAQSILHIATTLSLFGFAFDLKPVEVSKFQQSLLGE